MSRATEIAEAEAVEAEADHPDAEPDTEPDTTEEEEAEEVETTEPQVISEAEVEKRMKQLSSEADRHEKRVAQIMGDDFALLLPSPIDWTPGFVFRPDVAPIPEDARLAALALLGAAPEGEYEPHPTEVRCEQCKGRGKLATGSLVPNQEALNCPKCNGMGHHPTNVATFTPNPQAVAVAPDALPYTTVPVAEQFRIGNDAFGRPPGDPHYGVAPVAQAPASA